MKKILFGLILATLYLTPYTILSQVTYKDSNTSAVAVQRLLQNTDATGVTRLGLITDTDTVWLEADAGALDIQLDGSVSINGTTIGSGGADSLYIKYVTTAADTATEWKVNGDTLLIPIIAAIDGADSLYIKYITTATDTTTGWYVNGDTIFIPVTEPGTDYSWNYTEGSTTEITDGDEVEFIGYNGINLFTRSILTGGVQLGIAAAEDNQWFNYAVIWDSGLTFDITPGYHFIQGEYYSIDAAGSVTLDAAHATLDRIDVIAVDTNENFVVVKGTDAADPSKPTVDALSQLELTFVYIEAAATEPTINTDLVYNENEEWTTASTPVADVTVDFASAETPKVGDSCIFISHDTGGSIDASNISFTDGSTHTIAGQTITMYIRSSVDWVRRTRLIIFIYNGASTVGAVTLNSLSDMYGYDPTDNGWQRLSIPIEDFNPTDVEFDKIYILTKGFPNGCDLSFDYIEIQDESSPPGTTYNLLTQNTSTRTSYSIPLDNAAYISAAGNYRVVSTTGNVPTGVEGALIAIYNSTAASGMIYMLINDDSGDVYTSVDKGTTWTEFLVDSGVIFYSSAGTANNSYEGETTAFASSGALTLGNVVYISGNNAVANGDANGTGTYPVVGVVVDATNKIVMTRGYFTQTDSTFTANDPIYLSATAGKFSSVMPSDSVVQLIGRAVDANTIKFHFKDGIIKLNN